MTILIKQLLSTAKECSITNNRGVSLVEIVLASAVFALLVAALGGSFVYGRESVRLSGDRSRAIFLASEGLEAVRNIRDNNFTNLSDGTFGLATSSNQWILSGSSDTVGIFTRQITISSINADTKQVASQVTWQQNPQRVGNITLYTYLTDWHAEVELILIEITCADYCISQSYSNGTCRANSNQCNQNSEVYQPLGNTFCLLAGGGGGADTCCCAP